MKAATPAFRLAVVVSHPIQYYAPWFRWLRRHTPLDLRVFYLWDFGVAARTDVQFGTPVQWDVDLLGGYASEIVPNRARRPGTHHFWGLRNPELTALLADWRPDAVLLFGYAWASHLRAFVWARRRGLPVIFRGDSHFLGRPRPGWLKVRLLRALYRRFAAVTYVGAANRAYFETLGVPASRLFFAPHAVDGTLFTPENPEHSRRAAELRTQLRLGPATRVVLFAGKLVAAKQPAELLRAFLQLAVPDTVLVFVGAGAEKERLEETVRQADRSDAVRFLPLANQTAMPATYLLADVFVLPSRGLYETWGLAVNEAMQMGIPCIVSDVTGCQPDLVIPGETGWVFRADDPAGLADALRIALAAVADPAQRAALRAAVLRRIAGYTFTETTRGLMAAIARWSPPGTTADPGQILPCA